MGLKGISASRQEGLGQTVRLNNGVEMPWLGLGVFQMGSQSETEKVVREAIEQGYRLIDTAAIYGNEEGVGAAIQKCEVPREDLFVTTKLWNDDMRAGRVEQAFEESLSKLGLDYVDLYLLHWPIVGKIQQSWAAVEKLHRCGRIRAIGVSNYLPHHLDTLLENSDIVPAVNQVEYHPYLQSPQLKDYCEEREIRLQAWSPLMQAGEILQDPILQQIGKVHDKSTAQIILRWILQSGVSTIPKSSRSKRIVENSDLFDFELSEEEFSAIAKLDQDRRSGAHPDHFDF